MHDEDPDRLVRVDLSPRECAVTALALATYACGLAAADPHQHRDEILLIRDLVRKLEQAMLLQ